MRQEPKYSTEGLLTYLWVRTPFLSVFHREHYNRARLGNKEQPRFGFKKADLVSAFLLFPVLIIFVFLLMGTSIWLDINQLSSEVKDLGQ